MFSGDLSNYGSLDLVKFILTQGSVGTLFVENGPNKGEIDLGDGKVSFALWAGKEGEEAFGKIIRTEHVRFAFQSRESLRSNISKNTQELLDEAAKTVDRLSKLAQNTIVARLPIGSGKQVVFDSTKWLLSSMIGGGITVADLVKTSGLSQEVVKEQLIAMLDLGVVEVKSAIVKEKIYLFTKQSSVVLPQNEVEVLRMISNTISLDELVEMAPFPLLELADIINMLAIKKHVTVSDGAGKPIEPWRVRKALGFAKEANPVRLALKPDQSFLARPGYATVNEYLYQLWEAQLFGERFDQLIVERNGTKLLFRVSATKDVKDAVLLVPSDIRKQGLIEGDRLTCRPLVKGE